MALVDTEEAAARRRSLREDDKVKAVTDKTVYR
jgi:hypothetical protein